MSYVNGSWFVRDMGSSNGIKVNGERCQEHWLKPGDELAIAKHRYAINYTPDPNAAVSAQDDDVDPFAISLMEKAGLVAPERRRPKREQGSSGKKPGGGTASTPGARPGDGSNGEQSSTEDNVLDWLNDGR